MENSHIGWTHHTQNWWIGCAHVSPGCDHCYAETGEIRFKRAIWGHGAARHRTTPSNWKKPLAWNRKAQELGVRYRVFCMSLGDFFDPEVDPSWRAEAWEIIRATTHLDWQILTKRPREAARMLPPGWGNGWSHVWLGTSVEDMIRARLRIPTLLSVPAAKRFLSCEPMLQRLDLRPWLAKLDWVICGGESGHGWRPMDPAWAYDLRDQCAAVGTAFFMKQMAMQHHGVDAIPADLRVQQFPRD